MPDVTRILAAIDRGEQRAARELLPPGDSVDRRQLEARLAEYEQAAGGSKS
ncbi:MAG: hypothetical protein ACYSWT_15985 [Planctomycetota bacterium]|jgi:hypothetical protein